MLVALARSWCDHPAVADAPDREIASEDELDRDPPRWWLYLLRSAGGRSYVGITTEIDRRLAQHNGELPGGAKSTRAGRPWSLARRWGPFSRSEASAHEYRLKRRRGARRWTWEPS